MLTLAIMHEQCGSLWDPSAPVHWIRCSDAL